MKELYRRRSRAYNLPVRASGEIEGRIRSGLRVDDVWKAMLDLDDVVLHDGSFKSEVKPKSGFETAALGLKLWIDEIYAYKC